MRDETRNAEDELRGRGVLERLAVQPLHDAEAASVAQLRHRNDHGKHGQNVLEALRAEPLPVALLQVARGHVVRDAVAGDEPEGVGLGDPPSFGADDHRELGLSVHVGAFRREHDRIAGADDRARELPEEEWFLGKLGALLEGMVVVVETDADDLLGLGHQLAAPSSCARQPASTA